MKNVMKLIVLTGAITLISGCVNATQYKYKPASYSSQGKTHSEAVEYCSYIADNKTDDYYDKKKEKLRDEFAQGNRGSDNRDYATTTNCKTIRYGYGGPEIQCQSKNDSSGFASGGYQTSAQLNVQLSAINLSKQFHGREKYDRAYRDCMFNEGYKRVESR